MTGDPASEPEGEPASPDSDARTVAATYDRIAEHFSKTREHPWPEVEAFLADRAAGLALDVGCGNGRHCEPLSACSERVLGLDVSGRLLAVARRRARERGYADRVSFLQGDAGSLPVPDGSVDLAVYVATLHHLRPRSRRVASLSALARVLAPDGRALVSAWSTAHDRFDREAGFDTSLDWTLPGGETVPRYYHVYAPEEFEADLADSALRVLETRVSSGNCYATVAAPEAGGGP